MGRNDTRREEALIVMMALDFSSLKFMLQLKYYNLLVATEPKNPP
jgi:hypothetical protein